MELPHFDDPGCEYRGLPLWSWNCKLDRRQLCEQLEYFKTMGFGGAIIHSRVGLDTPYLGPEFMRMARDCTIKARELGLRVWLYDEDRWPSGTAGGMVTQDVAFRARHLRFSRKKLEGGNLLWTYEIELTEQGSLTSYRRIGNGELADGDVWYAYLELDEPTDWHNGNTYVDTLNPRAIERFIEFTHERYLRTFGNFAEAGIGAIFTDEPQFTRKGLMQSQGELILPYTDDFRRSYYKRFGVAFEDTLPEVLWTFPGKHNLSARYRYHEHVAELFATSFAGTVGSWFRNHGIRLTGHLYEEDSLRAQTSCLGEVMRSLAHFDLPGIDVLRDYLQLNTAKQAQSAARQYARAGMMSELYGVTGWGFTCGGHKRQGDWQASLGVTERVPHLTWVSMAGEAKRDYPASIGRQTPWFEHYHIVEDHFARLNTALKWGKPRVRVGVFHPVETYWLCYGPDAQTQLERQQRDANFTELTRWLLFGTIDFDFICESLLPSQGEQPESGQFHVGAMAYDIVIIPGMRTIRSSSLERLERFAASHGEILFVGEVPSLVDACPSERCLELAKASKSIAFTRQAVIEALAPVRELEIQEGPAPTWHDAYPSPDVFLHQVREEGEERMVFICNSDKERGRPGTKLLFKGEWKVTLWDTVSGVRTALAAHYRGNQTELGWDAPAHGSLLLQMEPGKRTGGRELREPIYEEVQRLQLPVPVELSEPNVLLLDQAEWRLGTHGAWNSSEEILRIDSEVRRRLNLPQRRGKMKQPWADDSPDPVVATLDLRFHVHSQVSIPELTLAAEHLTESEVWWDGVGLNPAVNGYFVDEAIQTMALPGVGAGMHELVIRFPVSRRTNIEWCYLRGDFGVELRGNQARIIQPVRSLSWGDWTRQGLPFYAGNVTYKLEVSIPSGLKEPVLEVPHFAGPLLGAGVDGRPFDGIALAPHRLPIGAGKQVELTIFGDRHNAFGPLHNINKYLTWIGPDAWRSVDNSWSYEYQIKPMGILSAPVVKTERA